MSKVSCDTIRDILPLYVDAVISEDTRSMVAEHLEQCGACRKKYENMNSGIVLPLENNVRPLKQFKKAWNKKKIIVAAVSAILTLTIIVTGYMIYENVAVVNNFFSPTTIVNLHHADTSGEWQQLKIGETGYLIFDSIFHSKELVLDANCDKAVSFRISDQQGNPILDNLTLQPGTGVLLDKLEKNTNYIVEIKTSGNFVFVRFF